MMVVPRSGVYGFGRAPSKAVYVGAGGLPDGWRGLSGIVTPGSSTYPSQDGTFTIIRGTGPHYGNGLIDGYIVAGTLSSGIYALDDNSTGSEVNEAGLPRQYKVGSELQKFLDDTPTSPEYYDYLKQQRALDEANNPKLKAYDDALRQWATAQQPPVNVDPTYGFATNFDPSQAPDYVQKAYGDFTGHPIPPPPPPPSGPSVYLIAGVRFDENGVIYDGTGAPTGQKLTPDEVHSLLSTGALPASSSAPSTTPIVPSGSPATTQPTTIAPTPTQSAPTTTTTTPTATTPRAVPSSAPNDANPATQLPQIPTISNQPSAPVPPADPNAPAATEGARHWLDAVQRPYLGVGRRRRCRSRFVASKVFVRWRPTRHTSYGLTMFTNSAALRPRGRSRLALTGRCMPPLPRDSPPQRSRNCPTLDNCRWLTAFSSTIPAHGFTC